MPPKSILIVDDEEVSRESLARLLASHGYDVRTAADSQQANQQMAQSPADIALLDLDLPHVPGDSIATFMNIRYPRTRLIFISGQYTMLDPERFGDGTVYLRKPIDIQNLLDILESAAAPSP